MFGGRRGTKRRRAAILMQCVVPATVSKPAFGNIEPSRSYAALVVQVRTYERYKDRARRPAIFGLGERQTAAEMWENLRLGRFEGPGRYSYSTVELTNRILWVDNKPLTSDHLHPTDAGDRTRK